MSLPLQYFDVTLHVMASSHEAASACVQLYSDAAAEWLSKYVAVGLCMQL